jgi:putative phosphoesterase
MRILVLSDSHSTISFMRRCVEKIKPDAIIHLGDHYDDAETLREIYPHLQFHTVAGNCDRYRCPPGVREMLCYDVLGVRFLITHGHNYHVKTGIGALVAEARRLEARVALYGHTHIAECHQEPDGMWVINPGTCGYGEKTAAVITVNEKEITACRFVCQAELEEWI